MKQAAELLSLTIEQWRALTDEQLAEWARDVFDVTRPSDKQLNKAAFTAKLKKAGISPSTFKQPKAWAEREPYGAAATFNIDTQDVPEPLKIMYKMMSPEKQAELRKSILSKDKAK